MKALEIFYLLLIFNVLMAIIGGIIPKSQLKGNDQGFEPKGTGFTGLLDFFTVAMSIVIPGLVAAYIATNVPSVGTSTSPLWVVYTFAGAFQLVYVASWFTFWNPIVSLVPSIAVFGVLFTFLVESIFVLGMIQMTTGGFEAFK